MPTITLDPNSISAAKLTTIFDTLVSVSQGASGGTIQMTDLLDIISFPSDVRQRIKDTRGPVTVAECSTVDGGRKCKAKNTGTRLTENLPGSGTLVGIIVEENFSCSYELTTTTKKLKISDISGLKIDLPGPVNPGVDVIEIVVPSKAVTITF